MEGAEEDELSYGGSYAENIAPPYASKIARCQAE